MPTVQRAYRYRMAPTTAQEQQLLQFAGARRWVWNWALARRKAHYAETGKGLSVTQLGVELVALKSERATAWLAEIDSQALQQAIRDLDQAFRAFFAKRARFPRFKAKKRDVPSFRIPQRALSRTQQGSAGRERARRRLARQYAKVANRRRDFLHKASLSLIRRVDAVCIEDLAVRGLARTKLSKSVLDASWSSFRFMLTYKAEWYRRHLVVIGRFYPSGRLCKRCGAINADLALKDREWTCACGASHDRDLNAARNIRHEGLRLLLAGGFPESQNASGGVVRPATAGAPR